MKLNLPKNTALCFTEDHSRICYLSYPELLSCEPGCTWDHDCYQEPHVTVEYRHTTSIPLSRLHHIFDRPDGYGRNFIPAIDIS